MNQATPMTEALGKQRRLQQATTTRGAFAVLAIDHRGPLRRALARCPGDAEVDAALSALKVDIVRALGDSSSAVLLDPETGVEPCVSQGALSGRTGLLVALDTGSTGDRARLETALVPDWDEAVHHDRSARREWLATVARERMQRLAALVDALGRPCA